MCKSISLYGFQKKARGNKDSLTGDYHAYAWCDVDKVFELPKPSADCRYSKNHTSGKGRSERGFTYFNAFHPFENEARSMLRFGNRSCAERCLSHVSCGK